MKLKELLIESSIEERIIAEIDIFSNAFSGILNDKVIDAFYDGKGVEPVNVKTTEKKNVVTVSVKSKKGEMTDTTVAYVLRVIGGVTRTALEETSVGNEEDVDVETKISKKTTAEIKFTLSLKA